VLAIEPAECKPVDKKKSIRIQKRGKSKWSPQSREKATQRLTKLAREKDWVKKK